jgi:RNA polymerase sigma-70 factor (ECF subfamily)
MSFPRLVRAPDRPQDALAERSDDDLMRLAQAGLRSAFAVLVERHARRVVHACSRFVNDAHLGGELAQDTWVLVWQGREKYRADGGFVPWLIAIARNHCRNHLRRRPGVGSAAETLPEEGERRSAGQLDELLAEERRRRVRQALAELPVPMREALLLRFAEELRYDEMTDVLGTSETTLRSRVHHGLKMLKRKLKEDV